MTVEVVGEGVAQQETVVGAVVAAAAGKTDVDGAEIMSNLSMLVVDAVACESTVSR